MRFFLPVIIGIVLLGVGCQGTSTPNRDVLEETQNAPVIGGAERDRLGATEKCLLNGDCPEGEQCIDEQCIRMEY